MKKIKKAKKSSTKPKKKLHLDDEEDYDNDDDFDEEKDEDDDVIENEAFAAKILPQDKMKLKKKKDRLHVAGSGSLFIPKKK